MSLGGNIVVMFEALTTILMIPAVFFTEWLHRKIIARMQDRVGPPVLQIFYDFKKLISKQKTGIETLLFNLMPLFALITALTILLFIPHAWLSFDYDFIVLGYLFILLDTFFLVGAFASKSPFAFQSAGRELLLMLGYETTMLITLAAFMSKAGVLSIGAFSAELMFLQMPIASLAFLVVGLVVLEITPFDVVDAEAEISAGYFSDFLGRKLALINFAKFLKNLCFYVLASLLIFGRTYLVPGALFLVFLYCLSNATSPRYSTYRSALMLIIVAIVSFTGIGILVGLIYRRKHVRIKKLRPVVVKVKGEEPVEAKRTKKTKPKKEKPVVKQPILSCPYCNADLPGHQKYCFYCGSKLEE